MSTLAPNVRPARRARTARLARAAAVAGTAAAAIAVAAPAAHAAAIYMVATDTYIDSYQLGDGSGGFLTNNQVTNYGESAAVKFVTSAASAQYVTPSTVRTLFTLPANFWAAIGTGPVASAEVSYTVRNDSAYNTSIQAARPVELHPLTQAFVEGTGGTPSSTMGGANNSSGATWQTYNGTTAWAAAGGDYDATNFVDGVANGQGNLSTITWDITSLVNNPTTRAEMQNDGLMLKLYDDYDDPNPQQFASLYSVDAYEASGGVTAEEPFATFTAAAVPEPASAGGLFGLGVLAGARRRRRRD
jgi:hypothetical protein